MKTSIENVNKGDVLNVAFYTDAARTGCEMFYCNVIAKIKNAGGYSLVLNFNFINTANMSLWHNGEMVPFYEMLKAKYSNKSIVVDQTDYDDLVKSTFTTKEWGKHLDKYYPANDQFINNIAQF